MENIFKNLFSQRHNMVQTPIIQQGSISIDVINAIGTCYDLLCDRLESIRSNSYVAYGHFFIQKDIERELWIHFANRRLSGFEDRGGYSLTFNEMLTHGQLPWNRKLDLLEYVCKWIDLNIQDYSYLGQVLKDFEQNINAEFDRLDYGYRIVNHCVMDITSVVEMDVINEAIANSKDNVSKHLQSAVKLYSARPIPDVRNSIKESITAVEAVCRELTGEDTLGKALKRLEDNGVVIHKMLKEEFTKFYVYTNDPNSGIRHALMDDDGVYVPTKDEAYYMLVSCSAFVNYLRRKMGR